MLRNAEEWILLMERIGALFIHDGNPKRPHPLLTSGKHSSGFFSAKLITEDEVLIREAVSDMLDRLVLEGLNIDEVDRVVGPATGATELAKTLAILITRHRARPCFFGSPVKLETDEGRIMVFDGAEGTGNSVRSGERLLFVEDVLTTGGSVEKMEDACLKLGGVILPFVAVIVNRSGLESVRSKKIVALVNKHLPVWEDQESCDLCQKRSEAISPKRPTSNWSLLNADYPTD